MRRTILAALAFAFAATMPVLAHHSDFMFDNEVEIVLEGAVSKFDWTNPHAYLYVTVEEDDGTMSPWVVELDAPRGLVIEGWRPDIVAEGDFVWVLINPLRNGSPGGSLVRIRLPSGEELGEEVGSVADPCGVC